MKEEITNAPQNVLSQASARSIKQKATMILTTNDGTSYCLIFPSTKLTLS